MPSRQPAQRLLACALALSAASLTIASEYRETVEFADVTARVTEYAAVYGADEILFVVDIDNTLLAMRDQLGSDQWFEWQEYLLEHEPDSPQLVAKSFGDLLKVQGVLFELGSMRAPEPDLPERIRAMQGLGIKTIVLTSRGDEYRPATQRELTAAGYDFVKTALAADCAPQGTYAPYDANDWSASGITAEDAQLYRLSESPRPVSYRNGVMMVAGQHKGAMLLTLLHRAGWMPKAVVYVDDHGRHVHRVSDAMARRGVEATVFHYHREDVNVKRFRYGDKTHVAEQWRRLKATLDPAAPAREKPLVPAAAAR